MTDPSVELALAELIRKIEVGFAKVDGQLGLLIQRTKAMETRADHQAAALERLDERVDRVEATRLARDEAEARDERLREDLRTKDRQLRTELAEQRQADAEGARRALMIWALVVTVVMGLLGAGVGALGLLVR